MTRPILLLLGAVVAAPLFAWFVYRLARALGFLDPPFNQEHAERRTIVVAMWAFLLFFSVFLFGYASAWPRIWAAFGVVNGIALVVFAWLGVGAARRLWKLRHPAPEAPPPPAAGGSSNGVGETPLS
jgi:amino acid transporter